ncbi:MAG: 2-C-methyl-D-erythritol 2,4-cyclodiphosphate synthase [Gammaproteobacteria bacterium WSBS_2016_MAG_OTU1]
MIRIGCGFDVHAFAAGRKLILGGAEIAADYGLVGHSDADVVTHAICDSLLGALALGDIGTHFPDDDATYKDVSSLILLEQTVEKVRQAGGRIINVDVSIAMEYPKIAPYINTMREHLARSAKVEQNQISLKATTCEKLGFVGRGEGVAVFAVALVEQD